MKYILLLALSFILINCKDKNIHNQTPEDFNYEIPNKPYYKFDNIEHYQLRSEKGLVRFIYGNNLTEDEVLIGDIIWGEYLEHMCDSIEIKNLTQLGFKKTILSPGKKTIISDLFDFVKDSLRENYSLTRAACPPSYSDILIFKDKTKVSGIVKYV